MPYCVYGECFLQTRLFFTNLTSTARTSSHMFGHHPATVRLAGRKRHARFESSEALAEQPAVARTALELHGCCTRVSLAEALLRQHIDGVARASSAGTESGSSARSLVLLTILAPVSRCARLGDQLGRSPKMAERSPKSTTEVRWGAAFTTVLRSAICQLPASASHSWSPSKRVLREHSLLWFLTLYCGFRTVGG